MKECDICFEIVKGNNYSNHRIQHFPPKVKCSECDFVAFYKSQIDYHCFRMHKFKVKQGRPAGLNGEKRGNQKPRISTRKVLAGMY